MHQQIEEFIKTGPLFVDPDGQVDLYLFSTLFREWQQAKGMVAWKPARIELESDERLGQRRDTRQGRNISTFKGLSKTDPVAAQRRAEAAAAEAEAAEAAAVVARREAHEAAEAERLRKDREREAEWEAKRRAKREADEESQRVADAERAQNWNYKEHLRTLIETELNRLDEVGILAFLEFCPTSKIIAADIAEKLPQAADRLAGDLNGYRWFAGCLTAAGGLKAWNVDDNGVPIPRQSTQPFLNRLLDPLACAYQTRRRAYEGRAVAPNWIWGNPDAFGSEGDGLYKSVDD